MPDNKLLKEMASKYIWWKTPDEAITMPQRVIAQVMNIGDYADVQCMANQLGDDALKSAILHAEPSHLQSAHGHIGIIGWRWPHPSNYRPCRSGGLHKRVFTPRPQLPPIPAVNTSILPFLNSNT